LGPYELTGYYQAYKHSYKPPYKRGEGEIPDPSVIIFKLFYCHVYLVLVIGLDVSVSSNNILTEGV